MATRIVTFLGGPMDGFTTNVSDKPGTYIGGDNEQGHYVYGPYDGSSRTIDYYGPDYPDD